MKTRSIWLGLVLLGIAVALAVPARDARAGQTKYDPKTKSFRMNYTYARLPSPESLLSGGAAMQAGEPQTPSDEQDRTVHRFLDAVNAALQTATLGNAKIESITL